MGEEKVATEISGVVRQSERGKAGMREGSEGRWMLQTSSVKDENVARLETMSTCGVAIL